MNYPSSPLELRVPAFAGISYPANSDKLYNWLQLAFSESARVVAPSNRKVSAILAPHLDLRVEIEAYTLAYGALSQQKPDRIILLGTGHQITRGLFSLCKKDFWTPLGRVPCDRPAVELLERAGGALLTTCDMAHETEHSLEFQLLFIQYLWGRFSIPIVPVLCGSFFPYLKWVECASAISGIPPFLEALRSLITENTLVVAGVDLSHIGKKFGHRLPGRAMLPDATRHDAILLEALCRGDAKAFWFEGRRAMGHYNVCGFSTMSILMEILPGARGDVLCHKHWCEDETDSVVSFASAVLSYG